MMAKLEDVHSAKPKPRVSDSHLTEGGVRFEMSNCCNAPVRESGGGLIYKYCSKCKAEIRPTVFG